MDHVTLRATERTEFGSRVTRRSRLSGKVPATVYGRGMEPTSVVVGARDLYAALHTDSGLNALINVDLKDTEGLLTVAREIQRHPVKGDIIHLDLVRVAMDEVLVAEVLIEAEGTPLGVKNDGGFVEAIMTAVGVSALPNAIPNSIVFDISEMEIGDTLKIEDLPRLAGVEYLDDPQRPILSVLSPRVEEQPAAGIVSVDGADAAKGEATTTASQGAEE